MTKSYSVPRGTVLRRVSAGTRTRESKGFGKSGALRKIGAKTIRFPSTAALRASEYRSRRFASTLSTSTASLIEELSGWRVSIVLSAAGHGTQALWAGTRTRESKSFGKSRPPGQLEAKTNRFTSTAPLRATEYRFAAGGFTEYEYRYWEAGDAKSCFPNKMIAGISVPEKRSECASVVLEMKKNVRVEIFHSFEEENRADTRRRANMSYTERLREFEILQERAWGKDWTSKPMKKVATWEILDW